MLCAPDREKCASRQRRRGFAFQHVAVTGGALLLIERAAAAGLGIGVDAIVGGAAGLGVRERLEEEGGGWCECQRAEEMGGEGFHGFSIIRHGGDAKTQGMNPLRARSRYTQNVDSDGPFRHSTTAPSSKSGWVALLRPPPARPARLPCARPYDEP